jgi:crotonobetaine/carnitine-CoA ligase
MDYSSTTWGALSASTDRAPNKIALKDLDSSLTYAEVLELVTHICGGLKRLGVVRGTVVGVMLDSHVDHALTWLSTGSLGAIECGLNPQLRGELLLECLRDSGAKILFIEEAYVAEIGEVLQQLTDLKTLIVRTRDGGSIVQSPASDLNAVSWEEVLSSPPTSSLGDVDASEVFALIYTSGSSGSPKGVLVTHAQTYGRCEPGSLGTPTENDVSLVTLPMFHVVGLCRGVYSALIAGGTAVILPKFSATRFWEQARVHNATCAPLLGSMASFIFAQPATECDKRHQMRWVTMAPPIDAVDEFRVRFGVEVYTAYGLTEAVALTSGPATGRGTGWLRSDFEMRLVDDFDREVQSGSPGELIVRAKKPWLTMVGYHNQCPATQKLFRNQWLHTGDIFEVLDTGELRFIGRKSERIRRRGENISASLIESCAARNPQITSAFAVAVPDDENVEDEVLLCVLSSERDLQPQAVHQFLRQSLPEFMVPRYIVICSEVPLTSSQKVDRPKLEQFFSEAWDAHSQHDLSRG